MLTPHTRRERRSSTNDPDASPQARQARRVGTPAPSWRQLRERPFVGVLDALPRCWCGRPQSTATGRCREAHEWPRP